MRLRKLIPAILLIVVGVATLSPKSKESIEGTPYQQWSPELVRAIMSKSPWAQEWGTSMAIGASDQGGPQTGDAQGGAASTPAGLQETPGQGRSEGENETHASFVARLMSSLVIRQAYVRFLEIQNNYETMAPEQRQQFDSKVNVLLTADVSQEVVLAVSFHSNIPTTARDLGRFFDTATTATLNQSAYLYGPRGRIDLMKYIPPQGEATGARFIFPRVVNGAPVLQPGDKEMRFEVWIPPVNRKLQVRFDAKKMVFQGKLDY